MSFWSTIPKPTSTKQFSMMSVVVTDMKNVRMIDLAGLSIVAVDIAPTQDVWRAMNKTTCQRWWPILLLARTPMPPPPVSCQHMPASYSTREALADSQMVPSGTTEA